MLRTCFLTLITGLLCLIKTVSFADEADENVLAYVEANVLATLYHELGHALIDVYLLPVLGQEEDAADVLSVVMIDAFYDEEDARSVAHATAAAFLYGAETEDVVFWDVHGPDEQRYYNLVCLFYGADPENRVDFADEYDLPEERREYCPDEFAVASESWGGVLDEVLPEGEGHWMNYSQSDVKTAYQIAIGDLLSAEAKHLNAFGKGSKTIDLIYEACDEENAFYDPEAKNITICTELVEYYAGQY